MLKIVFGKYVKVLTRVSMQMSDTNMPLSQNKKAHTSFIAIWAVGIGL